MATKKKATRKTAKRRAKKPATRTKVVRRAKKKATKRVAEGPTPKQRESLRVLVKARRAMTLRELQVTAGVKIGVLHLRLEKLALQGLVSVDRSMGKRGNRYRATKAGGLAL
jgi:hypothetical protein